jgi:hypothetical protein
MMIDKADGYTGLGGNAPHRQAFVAVALETCDRRFDERLASIIRRAARWRHTL